MSDVVVYWRPMCGYCEELKRMLERQGIGFESVDIWADRPQAALVRRATGGDEIVPTVRVGAAFLVNPSFEEVLEALAAG